ncbi:MAG TPA: hypothetical protein VFQ70_00495, partial [Candidatus Saccharimonadaceae bacterium]|nr:hypothetical protein [Candidatus Saccharimonadaceae bacterium]
RYTVLMVTVAKTTQRTKKSASKARTTHVSHSKKVDYYPNRMTFVVSALAVVILFLLATIVAVNS